MAVEQELIFAGMAGEHTIRYQVKPGADAVDPSRLRVYEGGRELAVIGHSPAEGEGSGTIELEESLDLSGRYRIELPGCGKRDVFPTDIFNTPYFARQAHYDGDDLGAVLRDGGTTFKVWAPTASRVVLNLFTAGDGVDAYHRAEMHRGAQGVWERTEPCGHGTYYTYTVTTAAGVQEAVDPYARAGGLNGDRGMVVDLSLTDPEGWESAALASPVSSYSEAVIWEVHVRDFSSRIASSRYRGKYLAFTETGLVNEHGEPVGLDYIRDLGITHVHLLPVQDFATVDEAGPEGQYNWGYDPKNYNFPEGSYSTDPRRGEVRIRELKELVKALHGAGIGVILDVVYNHTYEANSSLNRIVPYYYYRYTAAGENTSASGCGNDTASERYMFRKFMVDSAAYWVREYKLDGLRFDLMGLHDLETMRQIERAVHAIQPHAILYGEGWSMGSTLDGSAQADQAHISQIAPSGGAIGSVAVFNDSIRDGLRGSLQIPESRGYISGETCGTLEGVLFGLRGGRDPGRGWMVEGDMSINYMSSHDDHTLWDKLLLANPGCAPSRLRRMVRLGAALILLARGTPFWQAGEELLRTKGGDRNSYASGDEVNALDWPALREGSGEHETMRYYRGLIAMRRSYPIFTGREVRVEAAQDPASGVLTIAFDDGQGGRALAAADPHGSDRPYVLNGEWALLADHERAGAEALAWESGTVTVAAAGVRIYINGAALRRRRAPGSSEGWKGGSA